MKATRFTIFAIVFCLWAFAAHLSAAAQTQTVFDYSRIGAHPRLLLDDAGLKVLKEKAAAPGHLNAVHRHIIAVADGIIGKPPVERVKTGRRLLAICREALLRVFHLSYAYRMTDDEKYLRRAEQELLAVCAFSDWNPSIFLDISEMTMAVAIGYDWLYDGLSESTRATLRKAIIEKGLNLSLDDKLNRFLKMTNNWNPVCNACMVYGSLAIYEDIPELAQRIVERSVVSIPAAMAVYAPDGVYPEGYGYWNYGTSFQVLLIAALEHIFGHDGGMSAHPGFDKTAGFMLRMMGTSGRAFNFSDSGSGMTNHPAVYWLAARYGRPEWLFLEKKQLEKSIRENKFGAERLFPTLAIYAKDTDFDAIPAPADKVWSGGGENPVVIVRTGWHDDPQDRYLGIKAGTAFASHGHMDAGSFVYDIGPTRWAMDFGMQGYHSIEKHGISLFRRTQDSDRWKVFRIQNYNHNTLTVNGKLHNMKGVCSVGKVYSEGRELGADLDLTDVLFDVRSARRKIVLVDEKRLEVTDRVQAGDSATLVRWSMATPSEAKIEGDRTIRLTQKDRSLVMRFEGSVPLTLRTWSTEPTTVYDAPNPGTVIVGFEASVPAGREATFRVTMDEK